KVHWDILSLVAKVDIQISALNNRKVCQRVVMELLVSAYLVKSARTSDKIELIVKEHPIYKSMWPGLDNG
ncbi:MAG: hypothetical protein Q8927_20650, partial [Bacteroidota bacterium]|nr:hypothetical protein [Bacteroidota bacterium]